MIIEKYKKRMGNEQHHGASNGHIQRITRNNDMLIQLTQDTKSRQLDKLKLKTVDSMNHTQQLNPSGA